MDRRRRRAHVAVRGEVGLERADEIGAVLVVIAHGRCDRVLVERAHLLGVRREHPEQQAIRALIDVLGDRLAGHRQHVEHELGLLHRAAQLGRVGVEGGQPYGAVALQPGRQPGGRGKRRLGGVLGADRRQQRVDAPAL